MAKSRLDQFEEFRPSFVGFGTGWLAKLAKRAFELGSNGIISELQKGQTSSKITTGDVLNLGRNFNDLPLSFGHLPKSTNGIPEELSQSCPYKLSVQFDDNKLKQVCLRLFLLNPRFVLARGAFLPAKVDSSAHFDALESEPKVCGLVVLSDPHSNKATRFAALKEGLPKKVLGDVPNGFQAYNEHTLTGRFDLTLDWSFDAVGKASQDLFGRVIGIPDGKGPAGITFTTLSLFSPDVQYTFEGLLTPSGGLGIHVPQGGGDSGNGVGGLMFIFNPPEKPPASTPEVDKEKWDAYRAAVSEFNLTPDFKGLLFRGIEFHWLSDTNDGQIHNDRIKLLLDISAVSFGEGHVTGRTASWFTSFGAEFTPADDNTYLKLMSSFRLRATIAENEPKSIAISGRFRENLPFPYKWLGGRTARISMQFEGSGFDMPLLNLAIEGTDDHVLARLTPNNEFESNAAVALTLAPVVLSSGSIDTQRQGIPPGGQGRDYFTDIYSIEEFQSYMS